MVAGSAVATALPRNKQSSSLHKPTDKRYNKNNDDHEDSKGEKDRVEAMPTTISLDSGMSRGDQTTARAPAVVHGSAPAVVPVPRFVVLAAVTVTVAAPAEVLEAREKAVALAKSAEPPPSESVAC